VIFRANFFRPPSKIPSRTPMVVSVFSRCFGIRGGTNLRCPDLRVSRFLASLNTVGSWGKICFDLLPRVHARDASNFFPLTQHASYILLPVSQWKPRVEQKQFAANWSRSSVLALVCVIYCLLASVKGCWCDLSAHLHAQIAFSQIGQGYLEKQLCIGFVTPQITMGQFVVPLRKLQNVWRFR